MIRCSIRTEDKMRFPEFFTIKLGLMQILNCFVCIMLLEVFLRHWLIYRNVLSICEVLRSHLLHPFLLSLLIVPTNSFLFIKVDICSLISGLILNLIISELKVSFSKIIPHFLIQRCLWLPILQLKGFSTYRLFLEVITITNVEVRLLDQRSYFLVFLILRSHNFLTCEVIMRKWFGWELYQKVIRDSKYFLKYFRYENEPLRFHYELRFFSL